MVYFDFEVFVQEVFQFWCFEFGLLFQCVLGFEFLDGQFQVIKVVVMQILIGVKGGFVEVFVLQVVVVYNFDYGVDEGVYFIWCN